MKTIALPEIARNRTTSLREPPIVLAPATARDREQIYRLRHAVYAEELGQHHPNPARSLSDPLDAVNTYLVARMDGELAGFVSITPPSPTGYSIDKYTARESLPFNFERTY